MKGPHLSHRCSPTQRVPHAVHSYTVTGRRAIPAGSDAGSRSGRPAAPPRLLAATLRAVAGPPRRREGLPARRAGKRRAIVARRHVACPQGLRLVVARSSRYGVLAHALPYGRRHRSMAPAGACRSAASSSKA